MAVRHTLIFKAGPYDWSETYVDLSGSLPGSTDAKTASNNLANARALIMGVGAVIAFVRQSETGAKRSTFILRNNQANDGNWNPPAGAPTSSALAVNLEVVPMSLRVRYEIGQNHFTTHYHAGCPDPVFRGPATFDLSAFNGGRKNWDKWINYILHGNWSSLVGLPKNQQQRVNITAIAFNAQGQLQITAAGLGAAVGDTIIVTGTKFNTGATVDGTYQVVLVAANVYTTAQVVAIPPGSVWLLNGTVRLSPLSAGLAMDDYTVLGVSEHKRGTRGFFSPRGKQKRRKSAHG